MSGMVVFWGVVLSEHTDTLFDGLLKFCMTRDSLSSEHGDGREDGYPVMTICFDNGEGIGYYSHNYDFLKSLITCPRPSGGCLL